MITGGSSSPGVTTVLMAADQAVNNTIVRVNADGMLIPVGANEVWVITGCMWVTSNAAADFKQGFTVPAGSVGSVMLSGQGTAVTDLTDDYNILTSSVPGNKTLWSWTMFIIVGGTPGAVQLQFAQKTAHASDTTLLEGSCMIGRKIS